MSLDLLTKYPVDHVGVAVPSLSGALPFYQEQLGMILEGIEVIAEQGVRVAFLCAGESHIELLEPLDPSIGAIAKFITKRGAGLHHLALAVPNIDQELARLKAMNVQLIDADARPGGHGKRIAFIHPKATGGVLLELCESSNDQSH